jgi:hypothetical protein
MIVIMFGCCMVVLLYSSGGCIFCILRIKTDTDEITINRGDNNIVREYCISNLEYSRKASNITHSYELLK